MYEHHATWVILRQVKVSDQSKMPIDDITFNATKVAASRGGQITTKL